MAFSLFVPISIAEPELFTLLIPVPTIHAYCLYRYRTFTIIPVLDPVTEKNRIMFFSFLKEGNAKTKIVGVFFNLIIKQIIKEFSNKTTISIFVVQTSIVGHRYF